MRRRKFIPLNTTSYLADTWSFSCEQHGAYMLLLCEAHNNAGWLPDDDKWLARQARAQKRVWRRLRPDIITERFFIFDGPRLISKHLLEWNNDYNNANGRPALEAALRLYVLERDGYTCTYCKTTDGPFEVDHIHPVALGGSDDPDNLACACKPCNRSKGAKTLEVWRAEWA